MSTAEKSVMILGATSAMARATAHAYARDGYNILLAGHDAAELAYLSADVRVRFGVVCEHLDFDAVAFEGHDRFLDACEEKMRGLPEGLVLFFGYMADQQEAQADFALVRQMVDVNLTGAMSVCERFAARCEKRGHGFLGIVSSAAGDRGKQSNYLYGACKAGLTAYAAGLRNRLHKSGVTVTTLIPGFVDTKMTYGLPLPGPLVASPEKAGATVFNAVRKGRDVAYVPGIWRWIMLIIKHVPEWQFKKMSM
jgi:hypothetical protein